MGTIIYGCIYLFIHAMIAIGWWRWRIEGLENLPPRKQGGMLFVMNHVNWIDIPAIGALLPFSWRLTWLGKEELFRSPLTRWFFYTMYVIPVKRGKRDVNAINTTVEAVKKGAAMLVFPEGHRSGNGVLQPGRGGAIRIGMQSGAPLVPVAVCGSHHGLGGTFRRKELVIRIGEPFVVESTPDGRIPPDTMTQLTNEMMFQIAALLPEEKRGPYQSDSAEQLHVAV